MMLLLKGTTHYSVLKTSISYVKIWWDGQIIYWRKKETSCESFLYTIQIRRQFNFPSQCSKTTILKKENHHHHHINVIKTPLYQ